MAVKKGTDFLVYVDGHAVAASQSCSIDISMDTIDVSTKDSNEWAEFIAGRRSATISVDGLVDLEETYNFDYLFGLIESQTNVTVRFSTETSGEEYYQASAYCTSLNASAPDNESTSYSASFQLTGPVTSKSLS